jgi:hypothetical protein
MNPKCPPMNLVGMGQESKGRWQVMLRQIAGYSCLAVGIAGCVLPILPGIPMLVLGLGLLSIDSPWAARLRDTLMAKLRWKPKPEPKPAKLQ